MSNPTHTIKTTYIPNEKTRWETDIEFLELNPIPSGAKYCAVGTIHSASSALGFHWAINYTNKNFQIRLRTQQVAYISRDYYIGEELSIVLDAPNKQVVLNGDAVTVTYGTEPANWGALWFFNRNQTNPSEPNGYGANDMVLYRSRVWEDNVLIHDWVPAQRQADGVNSLYDTCTHEFLTNYYTANFIPHYL